MKVRNITAISLLSAVALILFVIEAQIPPIVPVPGIKLGLANVVIVFTAYALSRKKAAFVLAVRVILGAIFTGQALALIYSACGALVSFALLCAVKGAFTKRQMWAVSGFCAIAHNAAQLCAAAAIMQTTAVFWYAPALCISGIVTGLFTGFAAQFTLNGLDKAGFKFS